MNGPTPDHYSYGHIVAALGNEGNGPAILALLQSLQEGDNGSDASGNGENKGVGPLPYLVVDRAMQALLICGEYQAAADFASSVEMGLRSKEKRVFHVHMAWAHCNRTSSSWRDVLSILHMGFGKHHLLAPLLLSCMRALPEEESMAMSAGMKVIENPETNAQVQAKAPSVCSLVISFLRRMGRHREAVTYYDALMAGERQNWRRDYAMVSSIERDSTPLLGKGEKGEVEEGEKAVVHLKLLEFGEGLSTVSIHSVLSELHRKWSLDANYVVPEIIVEVHDSLPSHYTTRDTLLATTVDSFTNILSSTVSRTLKPMRMDTGEGKSAVLVIPSSAIKHLFRNRGGGSSEDLSVAPSRCHGSCQDMKAIITPSDIDSGHPSDVCVCQGCGSLVLQWDHEEHDRVYALKRQLEVKSASLLELEREATTKKIMIGICHHAAEAEKVT